MCVYIYTHGCQQPTAFIENVSCVIPAMQVMRQIKHKDGLLSHTNLLHLWLELNLEKFLPTKKLQDWNY